MTTLVIGARGRVGRNVLAQLLAAGEPVRASVRDPASAGLPAGVPVVGADLARPDTVADALDGVDRVFLYAPSSGLGGFIEAAGRATLDRVVLLSSGGVLVPPAPDNVIVEHHWSAEQAMTEAGLPWTPVRPLVLATNALNWAPSIRVEGVARLVHPGAMTAPVHERDIAAVVVAALQGRAGTDGLLTGPELLSQRDQAELIGAATGRPVRVEELSEDQARQRFAGSGDPRLTEAILGFIRAAAQGGSPATGVFEQVIGRPALPFAQWTRDHVADFR